MDKKEFDDKVDEAILKELGYRKEYDKHKELSDPKNKKTMSRLTNPQIKGTKLAYAFQESYGIPVFRMMYDHLSDSMVSHKGLGRGEFIDYEKASKPTESGGIGIYTGSQRQNDGEKKKRFWHRGKKVESSE